MHTTLIDILPKLPCGKTTPTCFVPYYHKAISSLNLDLTCIRALAQRQVTVSGTKCVPDCILQSSRFTVTVTETLKILIKFEISNCISKEKTSNGLTIFIENVKQKITELPIWELHVKLMQVKNYVQRRSLECLLSFYSNSYEKQ